MRQRHLTNTLCTELEGGNDSSDELSNSHSESQTIRTKAEVAPRMTLFSLETSQIMELKCILVLFQLMYVSVTNTGW